MKKINLLFLLCTVLTVSCEQKSIKGSNQSPSIVNIYNVVRKTVENNDDFKRPDYETTVSQIEINKQYGYFFQNMLNKYQRMENKIILLSLIPKNVDM